MPQNLISSLRTHAATLFLGFGITVGMLWIAWFYYNTPEIDKDHTFYKIVDSAHNQTLDIKMRARGPRLADTDLAIIAIDDRSLEYIGRWPWPRNKMADLIENLYALGAKSVGLDVVFAETSNGQVQEVLKSLPKIKGLDPDTQKLVAHYANEKSNIYDYDGRMSNTFKTHQDHLVAAAIYGLNRISFLPYQTLCFEIMYREMSSYATWDREGFDFIHLITDDSIKVYEELPLPMEDVLVATMKKIERDSTQSFCEKREELE